MPATFRWMVCLLLAASLLAACTRERPIPEPTAVLDGVSPAGAETGADTDSGTDEDTTSTPTGPAVEPEVASATEGDDGEGEEPDVIDLEATGTPTPEGSQETFQYTVQPNDTLSSIAEKFDTDVETLQELNRLSEGDLLVVGLPLNIPYIEGMTAEGAPTPTPGPFSYVIQEGDTLSGIAARFNVDQIQIIEINNLLDPNNLTVGATIIIPGYQPPAAAAETDADTDTDTGTDAGTLADEDVPASSTSPGGDYVHVVQPGEGLLEIAQTYGMTTDEIAAANGLVNPNVLRVGQELVIPGMSVEEAIEARSITHVVQSGESLLGIALQYGVTVEEVMEANDLANPDALDVGQTLIIPGE